MLMGLEVPDEDPIEFDETPVRQSRRIAQIKIKEQAERRKVEEIALDEMKPKSNKKKEKVSFNVNILEDREGGF